MTNDSSPQIPIETIELLRRACDGDRPSVEMLFERYAPRVRGLVALRMGEALIDFVDRDDILQEALLVAFSQLAQLEERTEGSFICWLAQVVHSRIANAQRRARTKKRGGGRVRRHSDLADSSAAELLAANGPSPSAAWRERELDCDLERAVLGLREGARQIVYCRLVLEMGFAEIAAALSLANVDSVRARFHKAMAELRIRLGD